MSRQRSNAGARSGFTMLELLVAVSLSTIVVSGLYGVFTIQSRQLMFQDTQMSMHQNLRFASDILTRTIRLAGYGTGGASRGLMGYDHNSSSTSDAFQLPAIIASDGGVSNSDAITILYAEPSVEMNTEVMTIEPCGATTLTFDMDARNYSSLIENYSAGELLMCWDYAPTGKMKSYLWEIASDGDSSTGTIAILSNSGNYADFDASCELTENLPPIMSCSRGTVVTYYIDADASDGIGPGSEDHPALMMDLNYTYLVSGPTADDVPLVDDIEDMQFEYCLADQDCSENTSWTDTLDLDNSAEYEGESLWMVRLSLLARTPREDLRQEHSETRPSMGNRSGASDSDGYHRQLLSTQVTIRNLRLL
jgi:prepilin-type N-terminal cleavage/methylation domain-containing protein